MRRTFIRTLAPLAAIALIAGALLRRRRRHRLVGGGHQPWRPMPRAAPTASPPVTRRPTPRRPDTGAAAGSTPDTAEEVQAGDSLLDTVKANGSLKCGVRDDLAGFSVVDDAGEYVGFDADFCRVIAAAVLGDATAVEFVPVATDARFPALQAGEIDVLVRNTTWTASRDGNDGATFLHPTFYDGQQMMVAADSGLHQHRRHGRRRRLRRRRHDDRGQRGDGVRRPRPHRRRAVVRGHRPRAGGVHQRLSATVGRATAASWRPAGPTTRTAPDSLVIFDDVFSKEPLTPAVIDGDTAWAQAVEWAIFATIGAEELGITSETAEADADRRRRGQGAVPRRCERRRRDARSGPRAADRLRAAGGHARSATTPRSSTPTCRPSASRTAASTPCGPTAACSTPRRTADRHV